jgi:uncharacterized membrane protein (UPF0127 family)
MIKKIKIKNKMYNLKVASTPSQQKKGLSNIKKIKKNQGMLFCYDAEKPDRVFTMKNTYFDLWIIFLDKNFKEVKIQKGKARSTKSIKCDVPSQYVIEIPA